MRVKNTYPEQQEQLIQKLEQIIFIDQSDKSFTLYDFDNDTELQAKIIGLIEELKAAFKVHNFTGINRPGDLKRPWLSIIRALLSKRYNLIIQDYRDKEKGVRTKKYNFLPKTI